MRKNTGIQQTIHDGGIRHTHKDFGRLRVLPSGGSSQTERWEIAFLSRIDCSIEISSIRKSKARSLTRAFQLFQASAIIRLAIPNSSSNKTSEGPSPFGQKVRQSIHYLRMPGVEDSAGLYGLIPRAKARVTTWGRVGGRKGSVHQYPSSEGPDHGHPHRSVPSPDSWRSEDRFIPIPRTLSRIPLWSSHEDRRTGGEVCFLDRQTSSPVIIPLEFTISPAALVFSLESITLIIRR